ncbi:hypothetical protein TNIN_381431 [Trichonephila inaurata madagascariensis]|uniref:Uncharacterized protein n=1 Tax=Trichonephila inaurata madagascariensis TaxID=2747483 RepID=A0A8X6X046_9ARAC|nr:hypothetical protein TNIN_381431 [Trichonephila inaurata madagascariensis]
MSKETLVVLNRKRGAIKAQLTRIKDFMNNPDEKDKAHLESKLDTLKSLRIKLSDIRNNIMYSSHKVALCKSSRNYPNCSKRHNSLLCRNFERNVDSQRSSGSKTLANMEPKNTSTLKVNSECFLPKQTIPSCVESFEPQRGEYVEHSKDHSTMLLSIALVYCQNSRGEVFPLRAELDSGNQSSLIAHDAAFPSGNSGSVKE